MTDQAAIVADPEAELRWRNWRRKVLKLTGGQRKGCAG